MSLANRQTRATDDLVINLDNDTHGTRNGWCLTACLGLYLMSFATPLLPLSLQQVPSMSLVAPIILFGSFYAAVVYAFMVATKGSVLVRAAMVLIVCASSVVCGFITVEAGRQSDSFWFAANVSGFCLSLVLFQLHRRYNPAD